MNDEERLLQPLRSEAQVLIEAPDLLAVEVDVEELPGPESESDGVVEAQTRHRLVRKLRVHADHLRTIELEMNASAWPTVGMKLSPRGSFGFGSSAKRMS